MSLVRRLHRDQTGGMSLVTVFTVMLLAMVLGQVINVGVQLDQKLKLQEAVDAAGLSGTTMLARSMNALTFTNHLLCDVFALTAFLREARDRNAESHVPDILAAWSQIGPVFSTSTFTKFAQLGPAILQKVPQEQQLVTTYSEWNAAISALQLPDLEQILAEEAIPNYQRTLLLSAPMIAQRTTQEIGQRYGQQTTSRPELAVIHWRTAGAVVGDESAEAERRTLPVVDPVMDADAGTHKVAATTQRQNYATRYLAEWNSEMMAAFDDLAKFSQFGRLWRSYTCGQLNQLLAEYPDSNLPMQIRELPIDGAANDLINRDYTYIAVGYWPTGRGILPGLFRHPIKDEQIAFCQTTMFVPRRRLVWTKIGGETGSPPKNYGGVPGDTITVPGDSGSVPTADPNSVEWVVAREGQPSRWDLTNQRWTVKIVPATATTLSTILQTPPPALPSVGRTIQPPNLQSLDESTLRLLTTH